MASSRALKLVDAGSGVGELREFADGDALTLSGAINSAASIILGSAATVNIGAAASNNITITGTITITAFDGIAAGAVRAVVFSGALTLAHSGTALILPGGASILTEAGDTAEFLSLGSGNWRCVRYQRASGSALAGNEPVHSTGFIVLTANVPAVITHNAGATKNVFICTLRARTANNGFSIGDEVPGVPLHMDNTGTSNAYGLQIQDNGTNAYTVRPGAAGLRAIMVNKSSGAAFGANYADWEVKLETWRKQ